MTARSAVVAVVCAALLGACDTSSGAPDDASSASPHDASSASPHDASSRETATAASEQATPTPSTPEPTASQSAEQPDQVLLGTGTVTVDDTEVRVSGDCDISKEFGEQPVRQLDDEVDVLLSLDNLTGDGGHDGPFAIQVRLLGRGELVGRTLVSEGAPGEAPGDTRRTTYEGEVEVAELQDRRALDFVDVATLHLEASQRRVRGDEGPRRRQLVVDVTCPISRPPG